MSEIPERFQDEADAIDASSFNQEQSGVMTPQKNKTYQKAIAYIRNPEKYRKFKPVAKAVVKDALQKEGDQWEQTFREFDPKHSEHTNLINRLSSLWAKLQRR